MSSASRARVWLAFSPHFSFRLWGPAAEHSRGGGAGGRGRVLACRGGLVGLEPMAFTAWICTLQVTKRRRWWLLVVVWRLDYFAITGIFRSGLNFSNNMCRARVHDPKAHVHWSAGKCSVCTVLCSQTYLSSSGGHFHLICCISFDLRSLLPSPFSLFITIQCTPRDQMSECVNSQPAFFHNVYQWASCTVF